MAEKRGCLWDYHVHSDISFDGNLTIEKICAEGLRRGLSGITFTEHWEIDENNAFYAFDASYYQKQIHKARLSFPSLTIGMGIELGLYEGSSLAAAEASALGWDFIIGSCHKINGMAADGCGFCRGKNRRECFGNYIEALNRAIKESPCFNVVGHLDLPRRRTNYENNTLTYEDFREELNALFETIIPLGIGIELNTAGWRYRLGSAQPDISILKGYRKKGGEIITCGSDAHVFDSIAYRIADAYDILRAAGFKYVSLFEKGQMRPYKL
jgi:histidinol-phosphatase (PHP family)